MIMIRQVAYYFVLGLPLFAWFGALASLMFVSAAALQVWNKFFKRTLPFSWHPRLAAAGFIFLTIHGLLYLLGR
jgi:hypothetical protein